MDLGALFQESMALAQVGGWEYDPVQRVAWWTEEVFAMLEVDVPHEPLGSTGGELLEANSCAVYRAPELVAFVVPEEQARLTEALHLAFKENRHFDLRLQAYTLNDSLCSLRLTGHPVTEGGKVCRLRGIVQNLGEGASSIEASLPSNGVTSSPKDTEELAVLQKLYHRAPFVIFLLDLERGHIDFVNVRVYDLLGYSPGGFKELGENLWEELIHPEDMNAFLRRLPGIDQEEGEQQRGHEYRVRHAKGHYVWLQLTHSVYERQPEGKVKKLLCFAGEIDSRRFAHLILNEEKNPAFWANVTSLMPNALYIYDLRTLRTLYLNPAFCSLLGYDVDALDSLDDPLLTEFAYPEDADRIEGHLNQLAQAHDKENITIRYRIKTSEGQLRWLVCHETIFRRDSAGRPLEVLGVAEDVSNMEEVKQVLEQTEEDLRYVHRIAQWGTWEYSLDNQLLKWEGDPLDNVVSHEDGSRMDYEGLVEHLHPEDKTLFDELVSRVLESERPQEETLRLRALRGGYIAVEMRARPVIFQGRVRTMFGTAEDVTERRKYEEKLYKLTNSKDRILGVVAHDLRNPISHIQGGIQMLRLMPDRTKDQEEEVIELMEEGCKRSLALIQELLEISEMEHEGYKLPTQSTPIDALVRDVMGPMVDKAESKGLKWEYALHSEEVIMQMNAQKFARVLENLVTNSLKFTEEGGTIRVGSDMIENGKVIRLYVADSGIGIPSAMIPVIFDKFSHARRSGLSGEKSTGLGMSIVKQIVDLHEGKVWVDSVEGQGTTFFIDLPIKN